MKSSENNFCSQLKNESEINLKSMHLFLNKAYYSMMFDEEEVNVHDLDKIKKFKQIESEWVRQEINACLNQYDCEREISNINVIESALKQHPVYGHKLFDYLFCDATKEDLKQFLQSESVLNLEFFDYLALSIVGTDDIAKLEIVSNLWDEAGQGNIQRFHTTLYKKLMNEMELSYQRNLIIENMSWEGVAGINLFSYLSLYPFNKMKYFGLLAATEMLDPPHYNKLLSAINRIIDYKTVDHSYYSEHEIIDVAHADGWLRKVIFPELNKKPNKRREFWLGFYMRLNSALRYYDNWLYAFTTKKAA